MRRTIYIREVILAATEPKLCPTCGKEDKLEKNIVFERRSDGKTILCTRCETLIVITNHNLKQVELDGAKNFSIMLKEPYLIRRITY
jgi:hypothetical protein